MVKERVGANALAPVNNYAYWFIQIVEFTKYTKKRREMSIIYAQPAKGNTGNKQSTPRGN